MLYEQRPVLRQDTIDRIWDLRGEIREVVWAKYPNPTDKRRRTHLERHIEGEVLTSLIRGFLVTYSDSARRRAVFSEAQRLLPLTRTSCGEILFYTEGNAWDVLTVSFDHVRAKNGAAHGSKYPERVIFGSILSNAPLKESVRLICSTKKELKEVVTWPNQSSSPQ